MSRFSHEVFHPGTKQYEANKKANDHLRAEGIKAGNMPKQDTRSLKERQENLMKQWAKHKALKKFKK